MAGYIMTLGAEEYLDLFYSKSKSKRKKGMESSKKKGEIKAREYALNKCTLEGVYSAHLSSQSPAFIGTLADYLGMKKGDDIYFFTNRKIYGIGELIDIENIDCRFRIHSKSNEGDDLIETTKSSEHYFVCTFIPKPYFFKNGVDMDEVLLFNPEKIKSLTFFSKRSFMKLDDEESEAIKNVLARKNEHCLNRFDNQVHFNYSDNVHKQIGKKLLQNCNDYKLSVFDYIEIDKKVTSEYYLEGAIMDLLRNNESKFLGKWDFIGRQFPASPPKPSEFGDYMDLFGYRYVSLDFPGAISKYIVIELKTGTIKEEHIHQTMKYVDWISKEYAKGDYSMIEAFTVGFDIDGELVDNIDEITERNYIVETRPVTYKKWHGLRFVSYLELLKELRERNSDECERT